MPNDLLVCCLNVVMGHENKVKSLLKNVMLEMSNVVFHTAICCVDSGVGENVPPLLLLACENGWK